MGTSLNSVLQPKPLSSASQNLSSNRINHNAIQPMRFIEKSRNLLAHRPLVQQPAHSEKIIRKHKFLGPTFIQLNLVSQRCKGEFVESSEKTDIAGQTDENQ